MPRRSSRPSASRSTRALLGRRGFLYLNLALALLLGGWYFAQPASRQDEVRRLVSASLAREKNVSPLDVASDLWQLYYANPASGRIAAGDKTHLYGDAPVAIPGPHARLLRVLVNRGYVVGYDDARGNPAWVGYHVRDLARLPPLAPRPDSFAVDRRTIARVAPEAYAGTGFDRGHLAPNHAIATRYGTAAQEETFLMSNITPQRHALNAGVWKELERKIATSYPARYEEVWVLTGPIFGERPRELRDGVQIPEAFFLVVIDEHEGKLRTLALIVPQDAPAGSSLGTLLTSIDEIEHRTQLDLLSALDDVTEPALEQQTAPAVW